jgi:DNA (cytosine-5)-methyltransferase 1
MKLTSRPPKDAENTPDLLRSGEVPSCTDGMTVLDLFSGIGGFSLGLERAGMRTIAFCEIDPFARKVLEKNFPGVPIHNDIREVDNIAADIVVGGFPCQPFSKAGKQRGQEDDRNLWPEMLRVIKQAGCSWVICENVVDLEYMGLDQVLSDLEGEGYTTRPFIIPAGALQREHARERLWIIAHNERTGAELETSADCGQKREATKNKQRKVVSRKNWQSCAERVESSRVLLDGESFRYDGQSEPIFVGGPHGIPNRLDRRRCLGNAVVPHIVEIIGRAIAECG